MMGFLTNLFSHGEKSTPTDPENLPHPQYVVDPNNHMRRSTIAPAEDQLATFRFLVGMTTSPSMSTRVDGKGVRCPNVGIYTRVLKAERKAKKEYKTYQILISSALGTQLLVAAALTALGASGSNNVQTVVTIFGAINTVIAGFLTYLKGSGLPNRLKYYELEWKKVREYIEQREREFCHPAAKVDLAKTLTTIERMYEKVSSDVEANRPETYISINDVKRRTDVALDSAHTERSESMYVSEKFKGLGSKYGEEAKSFAWDVESKAKDAVKDVEKYERQMTEEARRDVHDYAERRLGQVVEDTPNAFSTNTVVTTSEIHDDEIKPAPPV